MVNGLHIESGWADPERKEGSMNATLTTSEFNTFCEKVDILKAKDILFITRYKTK